MVWNYLSKYSGGKIMLLNPFLLLLWRIGILEAGITTCYVRAAGLHFRARLARSKLPVSGTQSTSQKND